MSSYKDQRKELDLPAGSLQDNRSTIDGGKWHHDVGALAIIELGKIATEINSSVDEAAATMAKAQIKVGRLLNEARALIPGDLQFGKWREQFTTITNKSTANKLMNLAKQVGEGRITQDMMDVLPVSTLKELLSAPDNVLSYVASAIAATPEEVPTRAEIRELVQEEKKDVPEPAEVVLAEPPAPPKKVAAPSAPSVPIIDVRKKIDALIAKPLMERVRAGNPYPNCTSLEWSFMVFGLEPDPASYPNLQTLDILQEAFLDMSNDEEMHKSAKHAYKTITGHY